MQQLRSTPPITITFAQAREVNCMELHSNFRQRVSADLVRITIVGGLFKPSGAFQAYTAEHEVRDRSIMLSVECENTALLYLVTAHYYSNIKPEQLMTRAQFVIEVQDKWEAMLRLLPPTLRASFGPEIEIATAYLRGTYTVDELGGIGYLENQDGALCLPVPERA